VAARLAFAGWTVHTGAPVFDPDTPTLLDFRTTHGRGARFVYVLPDDPRRALVEVTEFLPPAARAPADLTGAVTAYLAGVLGVTPVAMSRREAGVLPLRTTPPSRRSGHVLTIGARAGLIKASTGYAYQRIQRDCRALAASLARHGHPFDRPAPRPRHRFLDAVLLAVLRRDPAELERAFARLFAANPTARVLRFLDEDTRRCEEVRLMATLPPGPYLRAAAGLARPARR
jgi:lycopene beta-cyclase